MRRRCPCCHSRHKVHRGRKELTLMAVTPEEEAAILLKRIAAAFNKEMEEIRAHKA